MFKVEITRGSDPIEAALNRRVHDPLIEGVFNGRNLDVLDEIPHPGFVNHHELFRTKARNGPGIWTGFRPPPAPHGACTIPAAATITRCGPAPWNQCSDSSRPARN